jgi:hypothetical protein
VQAADGRIKSGHDVFVGVMRGGLTRASHSTSQAPSLVTPAEAGVQLRALAKGSWIPAFAGMTMVESTWQAADGRIKSGHDVFVGVMRGA